MRLQPAAGQISWPKVCNVGMWSYETTVNTQYPKYNQDNTVHVGHGLYTLETWGINDTNMQNTHLQTCCITIIHTSSSANLQHGYIIALKYYLPQTKQGRHWQKNGASGSPGSHCSTDWLVDGSGEVALNRFISAACPGAPFGPKH